MLHHTCAISLPGAMGSLETSLLLPDHRAWAGLCCLAARLHTIRTLNEFHYGFKTCELRVRWQTWAVCVRLGVGAKRSGPMRSALR
jgi:hypothetical protein